MHQCVHYHSNAFPSFLRISDNIYKQWHSCLGVTKASIIYIVLQNPSSVSLMMELVKHKGTVYPVQYTEFPRKMYPLDTFFWQTQFPPTMYQLHSSFYHDYLVYHLPYKLTSQKLVACIYA